MSDALPSSSGPTFADVNRAFRAEYLPKILGEAGAKDVDFWRCARCETVIRHKGEPLVCYESQGGCRRPTSQTNWTLVAHGALPDATDKAIRTVAEKEGLEYGYLKELFDVSMGLSGEIRSEVVPMSGAELFAAIKDHLKSAIFIDEPWAYDILGLFVLETSIAEILPAVFYIFSGGAFGGGKTALLRELRGLTGGYYFENVSPAAIVRRMKHGGTILLDEVDVSRGKDSDEIRDALLRQGYQADAAKYVRYNAKTSQVDEFPVYGPKAATFRSALDPALESRGFIVPASKAPGEAGYEFVLNGLWPDFSQLRPRIEAWGEATKVSFAPATLQEITQTPEFRTKLRTAVGKIGADRDSELGTVALLVAEAARIDVADSLRAALGRKVAVQGDLERNEVEELLEVLDGFSGPGNIKSGFLRVRQKDVKEAINLRRKERRELPVSDKRLALLRHEAGIKDKWLSHPGRATFWNVPVDWLKEAVGEEPGVSHGSLPDGSVSLPESAPHGEKVPQVSQMSQNSYVSARGGETDA